MATPTVVCDAKEIATDDAGIEFFEKKIRPVLVESCYRCHAADAKRIQGGLLLDTRAGIRKGGDSGAAVEPGKPIESLLLDAIRYESYEMPPEGRLPDEVIADFEHWIRIGAPDPRDGPASPANVGINIEEGRKFWSFQTPRRSPVPETVDASWPQTDIDRFILKELEANQLQPVADADRETLIRRAYYALIGLPPSPNQIDKFLHDPAPTSMAFEKLVDRLLESPRFGERWGRHWLDVVRFAESSGGGRTLLFPDAWRYRDYVIESFNQDLPYDEFLKQQIAGDLLEASDWEARRRNLTATAFLVLGPTNYELQDKEVLEMDIIDEQLDTLGKGFLGMTLGCARCHDHKFDPIPTRDYYAMAGILKSTESVIHSNVSKWNERELPLPPEEEATLAKREDEIASLQKELVTFNKELEQLGGLVPSTNSTKALDLAALPGIIVDDEQAEKRGAWSNSTSVAGYVGAGYLHTTDANASISFVPRLPRPGEYEVRITYTPHSNRSSSTRITIHHAGGEASVRVDQAKPGSISRTVESLGAFQFGLDAPPRVVIECADATSGAVIADAVMFVPLQDAVTDERQVQRRRVAARVGKLEARIKTLQDALPSRRLAMAVSDRAEVGDIPLAIRGVTHNPGPIVPRGVLQVATTSDAPSIPGQQSGRLELATWIASEENPLTARIMVNRVWHWLFGQGLVRTVDNFGAMGDTPSHPELLDNLAIQFMQDGWSVKNLIRKIMRSRVYQLASIGDETAESIDPDNRLLWRMNRRRLDAESIRDTLLFVSGDLDLTPGGTNIKPNTNSEYGYQFTSSRRSVYVPVFRNTLPQVFETFDFADPNIQLGKRTSSTTATQALLLMNHPWVIEQSDAAARRLLSREGLTANQRIEHAYRQVLGRSPDDREAVLARNFVGDSQDSKQWGMLYQTLLQSLDFRFVE